MWVCLLLLGDWWQPPDLHCKTRGGDQAPGEQARGQGLGGDCQVSGPGGDQPPADDLRPAPPAHGGSRPGVHGPDGKTAASRNCSQMTKYQILATLIKTFSCNTPSQLSPGISFDKKLAPGFVTCTNGQWPPLSQGEVSTESNNFSICYLNIGAMAL